MIDEAVHPKQAGRHSIRPSDGRFSAGGVIQMKKAHVRNLCKLTGISRLRSSLQP